MQVETAENRDMCDWVQSVLVFSQAHNLKVVGSNPTPATNKINDLSVLGRLLHYRKITANCYWKLPQKNLRGSEMLTYV